MVSAEQCCGCEACVQICSVNAIVMKQNREGFFLPEIREDICIHCNRCKQVCPVLHTNYPANLKDKNYYMAYLEKEDDLKQSASGGVATGIMRVFLNRGAVVYGVKYENQFRQAVYARAESGEDIGLFRGSKYIQSHKNQVFDSVKKDLLSGKDVLYIGLPCEIGGLRNYLQTEYENLYAVELICHGPTSEKVQKAYLDEIERKYHSTIKTYEVRGKKDGWERATTQITFRNGKVYEENYADSDFRFAFQIMTKESCYHCKYKGEKRTGDITIGDCWGYADFRLPGYNEYGMSVVITNTEKGNKIWEMASELLIARTMESQLALKNQLFYYESIPKNSRRDDFVTHFNSNGLKKAVAVCRTRKEKIEVQKRRVNKMVPYSIRKKIHIWLGR